MIEDHCDDVAQQWGLRLEIAYRQHRERIVHLLNGRHSMPTIEDALQEIFAQLLERMPASGASQEAMLGCAYLFQCVRRRLLRTIEIERRHHDSTFRACRRGCVGGSEPACSDPDSARCTGRSDEIREVLRAIGRLPVAQQDLLRLLCAENVRRIDGAHTLRGEESALGVRRHRALAKLRELLFADRRECDRP